MTLRLGEPLDFDPFADEDEDSVIDSPVKPEPSSRYRLGKPLDFDPFEGEEPEPYQVSPEEGPAEEYPAEEYPAEEVFEPAPEEGPGQEVFEPAPEEYPADVYDPYGDDPQSSDIDEPDAEGHSLWDIPRMMGKGAAGMSKSASMLSALTDPAEWAAKTAGIIGDMTQNEALQTFRDYSAKHGKSAKLQQYGENAEEYYDEKLSPAMKASMAKTILASGEEEGFFGEGIKDPWKIAGMIAESIPSTLVSMGGGALITKGLIKTGMKSAPKIAQWAIKKLVKKYGIEKVAGIAGGAIGEGGYSGLDNANNAYEEMMSVDQNKLKRSKAYREVYSSLPDSLPDEKKEAYARKILAMATAGFVGSITAVTTGLFGAPSGAFMGKLIGGKAGKSLWGNLIKGAIPEGVTEAGEETLQSGMERLVENISTKFLVDPNQELLEGTGEAMASGAVTGFAMGLGMGGAVAVVTPPKVTAKDLLTDGQDVTAEDILLGEDEAARVREKGKGKRFKGPESIEAEEEAGEFSEEELEKLAEKEVPSDSTQRPKGKIPGKKPRGQKPKPPAEQKPGGPPTPPSGVVQEPETDEGTPEAQERQKFEELVASLTPEEAKSVEDLIKDEKMPIKERLGLMQADLIAYRMKHPPEPGDRRKLGRPEAEARRKDTGFRAIFKRAQGMKEAEFVKSGHQAALEELMLKSVKGRKEGEQVLKELEKPVKSGMLDLMRRMGVVVEKDTDIAEGLKTVYARIKAGMMPRKLTSEMSKKELRDAINTDYLTGLRSKQAFEVEDTRRAHVASIDLDSLKYINDTFGHQTGDAMLVNFANALKTITEGETYHISGDEFVVQGDDRVALIGLLNKRVVDHLNKNPLTVITPDGKKIKYTVGFSYGTAETVSEAERNLARQKKSREITGKRAGRGETPPGLLEKPAKGKQAGDRGERAPEKEVGGRRLFTPAQLAQFDKAGIDVSKVTAKYKTEALQQLQFKTQHDDKTPAEYDAWVRAEYARIKKSQKAPAPEKKIKSAKHFTTAKRAKSIRKEGFKYGAKEPLHGTGSLGKEKNIGRFAGDAVYLSLDDKTWGKLSEFTPSGPAVPATGKEVMGKANVYYDYEAQKWMAEPGEYKSIDLTGVDFEIPEDLTVLKIDSIEALKTATEQFGYWDAPQFWKEIAKKYDSVSITNVAAILKENPSNKFFKSAMADQLIVLAEDKVTVRKEPTTQVEKPKVKISPKPIEESGAAPIAPPGDRWEPNRGAIPGEPFAWLDGVDEEAKAALIENVDEQNMSLYEATTSEGESLGIFQTVDEAAKAAEAKFPQEEKPKEVEDPHWAAVGVVSGGPVAELEKKFVIAWAKDIGPVKKGSDLYYDVVGVLSGGPADRFFAKGLSVTRKPPVLPTGEVDAVKGKKTSIITPGNRRGYSAVYAVVEADDLLPSHNAETFQKNPGYPEGIQERTYHSDTQEQGKVIANAQNLNSLILLSDDPTPTNGPPIITESGVVLGGNSRAMSIQRAYAAQKKTAKKAIKYKNTISLQGAKFGLKPADAFKKEKPVLVRIVYLEKEDVQTLHRMASDFNKTLTQGVSKEAEIASMGRNISMATVEKIGLRMANYDKSLRELLSRMDGLEILDWLIKDDVIPPGDKSRYIDSRFNSINEPGKDKIEKAIFGSILDDADLLAAAPKSYINKIERSLSSLARIKARGDQWDITPETKDALEVATKAKAANLSIREHLKQGSLFGDEKQYSDIARALAYHIEQDTQTRLAAAFKSFAADAMADAKNQTHLFPPRSFSKAFKEAFQAEVAERGTEYAPEPAEAPAPEPTRPTEPELMSPDQYVDYVVEKFKADDQDSGITYSERVKIEETGEIMERDIDAVELLVLIEDEIAAYESIRRCMGGNK